MYLCGCRQRLHNSGLSVVTTNQAYALIMLSDATICSEIKWQRLHKTGRLIRVNIRLQGSSPPPPLHFLKPKASSFWAPTFWRCKFCNAYY